MNFFGTDGIRGTYGSSTLNDGTAFLLGKSLALLGDDCPIIVVGRDTRNSGERLFQCLAQGVHDGGGNVINLGVLPTNAVGHFVRKFGGDYGVMITASHNPPNDNGLKVFDRYGVKLCSAKQKVVSAMMSGQDVSNFAPQACFEPVFYDIQNIYAEDVVRGLQANLTGLRIALDCCYGASYRVAAKVFEKVGASVTAFCDTLCGDKINVNCGATHPEFLQSKLVGGNYHLGFAFDGDADRLALFEGEKFVPNNKVFYAICKYLKEQNLLKKPAVVGTVLTNGGVESALNKLGINLLRSDVGDTNVFNLMAKNTLNFGGEESGHYLMCDFATTADAIINALFVAKIYKEKGSIFAYTRECTDLPYISKSIPITDKNSNLASEQTLAQIAEQLKATYPNCRMVLRKSGTEPKIRAYIEGENSFLAMQSVVATLSC